MNRTRRKFDKEFKLEAVKMVVEGGLTKAEVGRRLEVNQAVIGNWVKAYLDDGHRKHVADDDFFSFTGGHEIPQDCLEKLDTFLKRP